MSSSGDIQLHACSAVARFPDICFWSLREETFGLTPNDHPPVLTVADPAMELLTSLKIDVNKTRTLKQASIRQTKNSVRTEVNEKSLTFLSNFRLK